MNYPAFLRLLPVLAVALLAGCGSSPKPVVGSGSQDLNQYRAAVAIDSIPSGAQIVVNGTHVGSTPRTISVPVDETGRLLAPLTIEPDSATTRTLKPLSPEIESAAMRWQKGDLPPKSVRLAIRDPGQSFSVGGSR